MAMVRVADLLSCCVELSERAADVIARITKDPTINLADGEHNKAGYAEFDVQTISCVSCAACGPPCGLLPTPCTAPLAPGTGRQRRWW